jgi:hypothetical protein
VAEPAERIAAAWLTVEQVASRFELSRHAIYRRIRAGEWDGFISKLGRTLVRLDGLEDWLRAGGDRQKPLVVEPIEGPRKSLVPVKDRCAMCPGFAEVVDHCHVCGYVRGRLCRGCNGIEARQSSERWTRYRARCAASTTLYFGPYNRVGVEEARASGRECARLLGGVES